MNKTEEIIKCAQQGGYPDQLALISTYKGIDDKLLLFAFRRDVLDPKFFQAIGKAKGYKRYYCVHCKKDFDKVGLITCDDCGKVGHKETMIHHAMEAYYTNLTQSFDDAINYLYELIK